MRILLLLAGLATATTSVAHADGSAAPAKKPVTREIACLAEAVYFEARGTGSAHGLARSVGPAGTLRSG